MDPSGIIPIIFIPGDDEETGGDCTAADDCDDDSSEENKASGKIYIFFKVFICILQLMY